MLKLQHFGHPMQRADLLEKTLMLGKIEGRKRGATENKMVGWHYQLNGHECEHTLGNRKPGVLQSMGSQRVRRNLVIEQYQRP